MVENRLVGVGASLVEEGVVRAFAPEHVVRLTGLSNRQLSYWDKTGFFQPTMAYENRRTPFSRVYSFKDVVGLRTLGVLRKSYGVSLAHLRNTARELARYSITPWVDLILYVLDKQVYFQEPDTGKIRNVLSKQYTSLPLRSIIEDVRYEADKLRERSSKQIGSVERHRYVAHNAPTVAGTRIPVSTIRNFFEAGYSPEQIIREYPILTRADVSAALEYQPNHKLTA